MYERNLARQTVCTLLESKLIDYNLTLLYFYIILHEYAVKNISEF